MNNMLSYGVDFIIFVQQFRTSLMDNIFMTATLLGEEEFFLLALPLLFWCVDSRTGIRITCLVLLSTALNFYVKELVQEPRPFYFQPDVKLYNAAGYSFPSNHAQTGLIFWLGLAQLAQKSWLWVAGVCLALLTGFSRVYLGVHFATDVLAGWLFGAVLLMFFVKTEQYIIYRLGKMAPAAHLMLATVGPLLLTSIYPSKEIITIMAAISGAWTGLIGYKLYIPFMDTVPGREWGKLTIRALTGILVLLAIWLGLKSVFPAEGAEYYLFFRYLRYWLSTVWITFGAPRLFSIMAAANSTLENKPQKTG